MSDEPPIDDDASIWTDVDDVEEIEGDELEEDGDAPEITDNSVACFRGHSDCVYSVCIHPTIPGLVLTGAGDDRAQLWRYSVEGTAPGELGVGIDRCTPLLGHTDSVTSVGFNFDGTLALTGALDGAVKVWNVADGSLLQTLEGPAGDYFASDLHVIYASLSRVVYSFQMSSGPGGILAGMPL